MRVKLSIDRSKAAALFVDLQEEHRKDGRYLVEGFDTIIANVQRLQQAARAAGIRLFHSAYVVDLVDGPAKPFHPVTADGRSDFSDADDPLTAICIEVGPIGDEQLMIKSDASSFASGEAGPMLRARRIEWLFVSGVWTEACIAATIKDAVELGLRVILVKLAAAAASPCTKRRSSTSPTGSMVVP